MKNIPLIVAFTLIPFLSYAQGIRFTVFADPQVAWLKPETRNIENTGVRAGFDIGFEMDNYFHDNYAFSTGLSINNTGGKLRFSEPVAFEFKNFKDTISPGNIVIYRLQYLNLPLGMKFTTREIGYTTIFVKLGMGAHINIKSHADIRPVGINNGSLRNEINLFNLSYHIGSGIQYSLGGQTSVIAGFEFRHRFVDIAENDSYNALLNSVSLRLGVLF